MSEYTYAVVDGRGKVINIIVADSADASVPLQMMIPEATDVVLATEATEFPFIGGDVKDGKFRMPSPYPSWVWDDESWKWEAPVPYPQDDNLYVWDEESVSWLEVELPPVE